MERGAYPESARFPRTGSDRRGTANICVTIADKPVRNPFREHAGKTRRDTTYVIR